MREEIKFSPVMISIYLFFTLLIAGVWLQIFLHNIIWHKMWELVTFLLVTFAVIYKFSILGFMGLFGTPAITLTEEDIKITSSGYKIKWKDVLHIELDEQESFKGDTAYTILLTLNKKKAYEPEDPLMGFYHKYINEYNGPFKISMTELKGDDHDLYDLVEAFYHLYGTEA